MRKVVVSYRIRDTGRFLVGTTTTSSVTAKVLVTMVVASSMLTTSPNPRRGNSEDTCRCKINRLSHPDDFLFPDDLRNDVARGDPLGTNGIVGWRRRGRGLGSRSGCDHGRRRWSSNSRLSVHGPGIGRRSSILRRKRRASGVQNLAWHRCAQVAWFSS